MTLTRQQRRRLRKNSAGTAKIMAATAMHRNADGRLELITDPSAQRAIVRGYRALLENDCRPVVLELSPEEGAFLHSPNRQPAPKLPGVRHWAAFGLDIENRATFSTTWTWIQGAPEEEVVAEAERITLEHLALVCNVAGLPMEAAR
mgnify:CR=1 FL=1